MKITIDITGHKFKGFTIFYVGVEDFARIKLMYLEEKINLDIGTHPELARKGFDNIVLGFGIYLMEEAKEPFIKEILKKEKKEER